MEKTIFEKIIDREIPAHIVYEDSFSIAILDIHPKALGHTLVIPKKVSRTILEMNPEDLGNYFEIVQKVGKAVKSALDADGLNVRINVESAGNQDVFHTHTHIIPRYTGDNMSSDPNIHGAYSSTEEAEEYAEKIKALLS